MPNFPTGVTVHDVVSFSVTYRTIGGDSPQSGLSGLPTTVTGAQYDALQTASGNASNAGVVKTSNTVGHQIADIEVVVYDEAYSDAKTRAVFVFQNDNLETLEYSIPAPDVTLFGPDGITILASDAGGAGMNVLAQAVVSAVKAVVNAGATPGTYKYVRGYRSPLPAGYRTRTVPATNKMVEPGAGDLPGAGPGA